ncbi:unnamed protein product [Parajaminaea phylloscopi]
MSAIYLYPTASHYQPAPTSFYLGEDDCRSAMGFRPSTYGCPTRHLAHDPWTDVIRLAHARAEAEAQAEAQAREYRRRQQQQQRAIAAARAKAQAEEELRFYLHQQHIRERQRRRQQQVALQREAERQHRAHLAREAHQFFQAIGQQLFDAQTTVDRNQEQERVCERQSQLEASRQAEVQEHARCARAEQSNNVEQPAEKTEGRIADDECAQLFEQTFGNLLAPFLQMFTEPAAEAAPSTAGTAHKESTPTTGATARPASNKQDKQASPAKARDSESRADSPVAKTSTSADAPAPKSVREIPITWQSLSPSPSAPSSEARDVEKQLQSREHSVQDETANGDCASEAGSVAASSTSGSTRGRSRSPRRARVSDVDDEGNEIVRPDDIDTEDRDMQDGFVRVETASTASAPSSHGGQ